MKIPGKAPNYKIKPKLNMQTTKYKPLEENTKLEYLNSKNITNRAIRCPGEITER